MSIVLIRRCNLCLQHTPLRLKTVTHLLRYKNVIDMVQLAPIATSKYWRSKTSYRPQGSDLLTVKKSVVRPWKETPSLDRCKNFPQYCLMLSKFRLTSLVVMTSVAGYALAPAACEPSALAACALGTALVSAAANALNQFAEVPFDAQMSRTKNRVLVLGRLEPVHAVSFAAATGSAGLCALFCGANGVTAALGAANLLLYTSVYTPMKRISILNTWIGSVVGAIPPLMGWAACAGSLDAGALALGAVLYSWQFPHFNALSWNLRQDYSKAGYRMMVVTDPALCRRVALRHTGVITCVCAATPYLGVTSIWFTLEVLPLNLYFMYLAWQFYKNSDRASSRKLFRFSLLHLPLLMVLMLANKEYLSSAADQPKSEAAKVSDPKVVLLPRGAVVAAQELAPPPPTARAGTRQPPSCTETV